MDINRWNEVLENTEVLFKPVVSTETGVCTGYISSLNIPSNFENIENFWKNTERDGVLEHIRSITTKKIVFKFVVGRDTKRSILFCPAIESESLREDISHILKESVCYLVDSNINKEQALNYKKNSQKIGFYDFGFGDSLIESLYNIEPYIIFFSPIFTEDIALNIRKRMFVSAIVKSATELGIKTVAQHISSEEEFFVCKEAGFDYVCGDFIAPSTNDLMALSYSYAKVSEISDKDRRKSDSDKRIIYEMLERVPPVKINANILNVFGIFRKNPALSCIAVVDEAGEPVGVIRERDMRPYIYSPHGIDLLRNKIYTQSSIRDFIRKYPFMETSSKISEVVKTFSTYGDLEGVVVVENGLYVGFLWAQSIVQSINKKRLSQARDANPLTGLPGNSSIENRLSFMVGKNKPCAIAYFDFDNFKPFNDRYGFRTGDRALLLFADILKEEKQKLGFFAGHIGGDDFFASITKRGKIRDFIKMVRRTSEKFSESVISFYSEEDRIKGYIEMEDRFGEIKRFPLLGVSAVILILNKKEKQVSLQDISAKIARLKKEVKNSGTKSVRIRKI